MKKRLLPLILLALLVFPALPASPLKAQCIIKNEGILVEKSADEIKKLCTDILEKTGVHLNLAVIRKLPPGERITQYETELFQELKAPYILVTLSAEDKKIDLHYSQEVIRKVETWQEEQKKASKEGELTDKQGQILNKDHILDDYFIFVLKKKNKEMALENHYSAALLLGTVKIAKDIGTVYGVQIGLPFDPDENHSKFRFNWLTHGIPLLTVLLFSIYIVAKKKLKKSAV